MYVRAGAVLGEDGRLGPELSRSTAQQLLLRSPFFFRPFLEIVDKTVD